ncbi:MAG: hypothetical protein SFT81_05860 [Candidatus Caenarcaniphilales bacterium]|nr:hypothetical protein [Candidatus Caenarcaniphilales bacterium]
MSVYKLLDRIMALVERSPGILGMRLVPSDEMHKLIEQISNDLPDVMAVSNEVKLQEKQIIEMANRRAREMIEHAELQANQTLARAREQAHLIVQESEVIKAIHEEAHRIREQVREEASRIYQQTEKDVQEFEHRSQGTIQETLQAAIEEAETIRRGAYHYADTILMELERVTQGAMAIVQTGQKQISKLPRIQEAHRFKQALKEGQPKSPTKPEIESTDTPKKKS